MKVTSKARYAVTAMLDVALNGAGGPVSLSDIAGRHALSQSYLEQLFSKLRQNGLVSSMRGPRGGYWLGKPASDILIADIVSAIEHPIDATACKGAGDCRNGRQCLTHTLWTDLNQVVEGFLKSITLLDLKNKAERACEPTDLS
jgi:Rrf2 family transcriptional regulator, iron-sulfur cluster assembly transcription factor